mmetsp:Transcript_44961/g.88991  ORF Transcript_44961/g.88991 Transcript_44961/m.88991 type:complete len:102 (-) Transcript_44961:45-350(-)
MMRSLKACQLSTAISQVGLQPMQLKTCKAIAGQRQQGAMKMGVQPTQRSPCNANSGHPRQGPAMTRLGRLLPRCVEHSKPEASRINQWRARIAPGVDSKLK